jgi:hypothetical protein
MTTDNSRTVRIINRHGATGSGYGLGLIGALIYYLQHATTFGMGIFGVLKAIVWPAILVYHLFGLLKL